MNDLFDVVCVANGNATRMGFDKLSAFLGETTVLSRACAPFRAFPNVGKIIVVSDRDRGIGDICVSGGTSRSASVRAGLAHVTAPYVLIHDGARPFLTEDLVRRLLDDVFEYRSAVPYIPVTDSLRRTENGNIVTVPREDYVLLQTPQAFRTEDIKRAYSLSDGKTAADDSALYAEYIGAPHLTRGEISNKKITYAEDLFGINAKVGTGFDVHRLVPDRPLRLCGVTVPYSLGEEAHSDGDAPVHALMDALLTAANLPDIGTLFPDTDDRYLNIDSTLLLAEVTEKLARQNRTVRSADIVILLQQPKIAPYVEQMRSVLAQVMRLPRSVVNISATTTERLGLIGDGKGVAALAAVTLL